jgi:hypothetical protein
MKKPLYYRASDRRTAYERLIDSHLERIQAEVPPEKSQMVVAINVATGEYVLGKDSGEAAKAYLRRWPNGGFYMCRVDGTPSGRM